MDRCDGRPSATVLRRLRTGPLGIGEPRGQRCLLSRILGSRTLGLAVRLALTDLAGSFISAALLSLPAADPERVQVRCIGKPCKTA